MIIDKGIYDDAVLLLQTLIRRPSFSREEGETARILASAIQLRGTMDVHMSGNNVWLYNKHYDPVKPTILLCSHHDTVKPNPGYTRDPFDAEITEDGRLYGLGSNDAGGSLTALGAAFRHYYAREDLKYNLCIAFVAEEEISGAGGIRSILPQLGPLDFAIIGEPTGMHLAIAEKGLMVLDCIVYGRAGHAAREEGDNAILRAMKDIEWFRDYRFPLKSDLSGEMKMSVTMISAGTQHNIVPAECRFTVDVRITEKYTNEDVLEIIRNNVSCEVVPRSTHLKPSYISPSHPIVAAGIAIGRSTFGSPTTSDQVALDIPSVKIGPGESSRSHNADEYILLSEIEEGIDLYIELLGKIL